MDFGRGTDLIRGKPGIAHASSVNLSPTGDAWGARSIRLVTAIAVVWLSAEIVNLLWPRPVNSEWYLNWGSIIMTVVLGVLGGLIVLWKARPGSSAAGPAQRAAPVVAEAEDA